MMTFGVSMSVEGTLERSAPASHSIDIDEFELVRRFVEHLIVKNASGEAGNGSPSAYAFDWETVSASVADSRSIEHAIGRAVVIADQLARGIVQDSPVGDSQVSVHRRRTLLCLLHGRRRARFRRQLLPNKGCEEGREDRRIRRTAVTPAIPVMIVLLYVTQCGHRAR